MKRFRKLIPALLLVVFGYCMPVSAKDAKNDAIIQWKANEDQKGASLMLAPTEDMIGNAVTTLQITLQIEDASGKLTDAGVTFDTATAEAYRTADYKYTAATKELNIFISNPKALFDGTKKSCRIGDVKVNVAAPDYQVSIIPVAIKSVDQSHVIQELKGDDLKGMDVTLTKSGGTIPSPDDPNTPNPDKPNPDKPNPDKPNPDKPNPDKPNPDKPNPDKPNPDKPNPDKPNPDKPNPDKPNPDKPNPDKPNPDNPTSDAVFDKAGDVVEALNNGKQPEVTYNIGKDTTVSDKDQKAIFKALKGKDKAVTFDVEDGGKVLYSFTFWGNQLTDADMVMDFKMKSGVSNKEIEKLMGKDSKYLILDFAHSGALPGPAEVKAYVGDKFTDGQKLFLYYYNPDKKAVESVQKDIVVIDGYATFELKHCSSYVLTDKEIKGAGLPTPQANKDTNKNNKTPHKESVLTGDTAPIAIIIVVLILAAGGIAWALWRKAHK